ncbi:MAG: hypothetical protein N3F11_01775 [Casimicrobiaceae bacterium]|nr:hypothetical protein [Casimicrobiaceae bacterium]
MKVEGYWVEIQVRTQLQDAWAQGCEKLAGHHPDIKYGGGPADLRQALDALSAQVAASELAFRQANQGQTPVDPDIITLPEGLPKLLFAEHELLQTIDELLASIRPQAGSSS